MPLWKGHYTVQGTMHGIPMRKTGLRYAYTAAATAATITVSALGAIAAMRHGGTIPEEPNFKDIPETLFAK